MICPRLRRNGPRFSGPVVKIDPRPGGGEPMGLQRKVHSAGFKAKVALAAHKADRTVNQLAGQYDVHPTQIHAWKKQLLAGAEAVFANGAKVASADAVAPEAELYEQIGRLKMELEWVKKKTLLADLHRGGGTVKAF